MKKWTKAITEINTSRIEQVWKLLSGSLDNMHHHATSS